MPPAPTAHNPDWSKYYGAVAGKPPRDTLIEAADSFGTVDGTPRRALDLGAGSGRDTLELVARGWRVTAVDPHPESRERILDSVPADRRVLVTHVGTRLEDFEPGERVADLVNASFSLPFVDPGAMAGVWDRIGAALVPGGRFAGQLFGDRDTWAEIPGRSHFTRARALGLFDRYVLERFDEHEKDGPDALGEPKHFHVFHVIAQRRDRS